MLFESPVSILPPCCIVRSSETARSHCRPRPQALIAAEKQTTSAVIFARPIRTNSCSASAHCAGSPFSHALIAALYETVVGLTPNLVSIDSRRATARSHCWQLRQEMRIRTGQVKGQTTYVKESVPTEHMHWWQSCCALRFVHTLALFHKVHLSGNSKNTTIY